MAFQISDRQVDEIRYRTDIVELIGSYVTLKRAGTSYKACCPFHKEKTPSFVVNPARQSFKCFGCGEGGDCFSFVMKHQGLDFIAAVKLLAEKANIQIDPTEDRGEGEQRRILQAIHGGLAGFYQRCLQQLPEAEAARRYLRERKLDGEIAGEFGLGYAPRIWDASIQWAAKQGYTTDQMIAAGLVVPPSPDRKAKHPYDRFRDRLMFPIWDTQGRVVAFSGRVLQKDAKAAKYVNSPETPLFQKSRILYALDKARRHIVGASPREAIVCEGQIDVIRCHAAGFRRAVASQGTAFTEEHVALLARHADGVVIVFDSDSAGRDAAVKTARLFIAAGMVARVACLPDGEDPDSFIMQQGVKAFQKLLDEARSVVGFQIDIMASRERDARSLDGVAHISGAVLETIALCPNAILRAHMLKETSERLNIPEAAMAQELAGALDRQARQAPRQASPRGGVVTAAARQVQDRHPDAGRLVVPPAGVGARPRDELTLCEHMVHAADHPELAALVGRYLNLDMISDDACRGLVAIACRAIEAGLDIHEALLEFGANEDVSILAEEMLDAPARMRGGEFSRQDAVQDVILSLWQRRVAAERAALTAIPSADRTPEQRDRWRELMIHHQSLKRWEIGSQVIEMEMLG